MEFEEIIKKVHWLDDLQRKSKTELGELGTRLSGLNTNITLLAKQLKGIDQQVGDLKVAAARMEQFDRILAKERTDIAKALGTLEKSVATRQQEVSGAQQGEIQELRKSLDELRAAIGAEQASQKERAHEDQRRTAAMQDFGTTIESVVRLSRDVQEAYKSVEEGRRQDAKRLADLQAELAAVRRRADEAREKTALHNDNLRNLENRMNELLETDAARQDKHSALLQQQALQQVDRDRAWKEWQDKYEGFRAQAGNIETQVAAFEDAVRAAKQAQEAYDGLNQRLERRIAEVGEIQRLSDERMRQEWIAFKADEQKRWTGHTLAHDEALRDLRKDVDRMESRLSTIDDTAQTLQDQLQQTTDTTEKQLQELMNISQDWLSAYERIMGNSGSKARKSVR